MSHRDPRATDEPDQRRRDEHAAGDDGSDADYPDAHRAGRRARWKRLATAAGVALLAGGMHVLRRLSRRRR